MTLGIVDLRERPHHADAVVERIWKACWKHHGTPLAHIRDGLAALLKGEAGMPFALVTESGGRGLRQHLGHRQRRTGKTRTSALIDEATRHSQVLGVPHLYLVSRPALREFYTGPDWRELESEVGQHRQVLYARELGAVPSRL